MVQRQTIFLCRPGSAKIDIEEEVGKSHIKIFLPAAKTHTTNCYGASIVTPLLEILCIIGCIVYYWKYCVSLDA